MKKYLLFVFCTSLGVWPFLTLNTSMLTAEHRSATVIMATKPVVAVNKPVLQKTLEIPVKSKVASVSPATTSVSVPTPDSGSGCRRYRSLVWEYDWPVHIMMAIMQAESGCNPNAINTQNYDGIWDYGLFQLHGEDILDPAANIQAAYYKYKIQGLRAWVSYTSGTYEAYL